MLHTKIKIILSLLLLAISTNITFASDFEEAMKYFNKRAESVNNGIADKQNVEKALSLFKSSFGTADEVKAAEYYMRATYFKSTYCYPEGDKIRKAILSEGKKVGKEMLKKHPNSASITYWNAVMLGAWAKESGVIAAAKEGVIDQLKKYCEKVIELDKNYEDGGGYRFLGILHLDAPYIPFLLTWPDDEEAVELLRKSYKMNPNNISCQYYLAKALNEIDEKDEAKIILRKVLKQKPSPTNYLEEKSELDLCRGLLNDLEK